MQKTQTADLYFFDRAELISLAQKHRQAYETADPFPSIAIDDLLPLPVAKRIAKEFPKGDEGGFAKPENTFQSKKRESVQNSDFAGVTPFVRHILNEFSSRAFLEFLENLTGIKGLIPDPHLSGGGLHQILPGGKLAVHADFNLDPRRHLVRRVNVLIYFNPEWKEEYHGELELWATDMSRCVRKIAPLLNRCVVFTTSATSFHGHPEPLRCPDDTVRNSMAFYYYTAPKNFSEVAEHTTLWKSRPGVEEASGEGDRVYSSGIIEDARRFLKRQVRQWVPPIVATKLRRFI